VTGPTGCGKSTIVPKLISESRPRGRVICTQPRRLAVVAVATHVAAEMGAPLGGERVGYSIGGASSLDSEAAPPALHFVTSGFLL
jgi:HrpA-like RNA helicase